MAASSSTQQKAPSRSARAPHVNLFDMPELMPGAQPKANPAQREDFHQRSVLLHREEERDRQAHVAEVRQASGAEVTCAELQAMFPALDASLVAAILVDARSPQHAIETLLALSEAAAEPGPTSEAARPASPLPRNLGVEDHELFPSLMDADGWQVGSQRLFERDPDEEQGSVWRDRAKAAKDVPAPKVTPAMHSAARRRPLANKEGYSEEAEGGEWMTDYEFRHRVGQRRAKHRAQFGRGKGRALGQAEAPGTGDAEEEAGSDEEVTEEQ